MSIVVHGKKNHWQKQFGHNYTKYKYTTQQIKVNS